MSVKHFCDQCGTELGPLNSVKEFRLEGVRKKIQFAVMTGKAAGAMNDGDWCKYCIIDAVNSLDDRPRAAT